ncbi:glycosyltransferase family 2 protein, partial [Bacteroidota bacterium]
YVQIITINIMKISIITPTYNSEQTIEYNLSSIIAQTYKNFEHIIIDKKSNDNTLEIIKYQYANSNLNDKVKFYSDTDNGIADAFNKGIRASTGQIITFLNSDDKYYHKNVFQRFIQIFKDDSILIAHGDVYFYDPIYGSVIKFPRNNITDGMVFNHPTMFFRRELFENNGLYNTSYKYAMDFEFICRLISMNPDIRTRMKYVIGPPIVVMAYGGVSWKNATLSIHEAKNALKFHGLWNCRAYIMYKLNLIKTAVKIIFVRLGLSAVLKLIRKLKWTLLHPHWEESQ